MITQMIDSIPQSVATCFLKYKADSMQAHITGISQTSLSCIYGDYICDVNNIIFCYFDFEKQQYCELNVSGRLSAEQKEFCWQYTFETEDIHFMTAVDFVVNQYYRYVKAKLYSVDNEFSRELVGYPSEKDMYFSENYVKWENRYLDRIEKLKEKVLGLHNEGISLAISLDNQKAYEAYVKGMFLGDTDIMRNADLLYVGNATCKHLMPDTDMLECIVSKACEQKKGIVLVMPLITESENEELMAYFDAVFNVCQRYNCNSEVQINDWGYIKLLEPYRVTMTLGTLLNRQKKDPRYRYVKAFASKPDSMYNNQADNVILQDMLSTCGITRYEYETSGYVHSVAGEQRSLHIPMYRTNTAKYCSLYALVKYSDRSKQKLPKKCPGYCKDYALMYPDHLNMAGVYNSLAAFDEELLENPDIIDDYISRGIDRIVWNQVIL